MVIGEASADKIPLNFQCRIKNTIVQTLLALEQNLKPGKKYLTVILLLALKL